MADLQTTECEITDLCCSKPGSLREFITVASNAPAFFLLRHRSAAPYLRLMALARVQRPETQQTRVPRPPPLASVPSWGMTHTVPAGADVLDAGLLTRAEAFVGWVDGPIGE